MALVRVKRDSISGSSASSNASDVEDDCVEDDGSSYQGVSSSKSSKKRHGSVSEHFFAMQGAALILPRQSCLSNKNLQLVKQFGGELQTHLHAIFHHLRAQDNIKLAVRLESWKEEHRRYLVIISTTGRQDTEESIIVGCDFERKKSTTCTIGLVLPLWCDTNITLDGDGGFHIESRDRIHNFKPVSVQAMWSALQSLHRCVEVSRRNNYYEGSLYMTWIGFYTSKIMSERVYINEWHHREDLYLRKEYYEKSDPKRLPVERLIRSKLKKVMMEMDLDNCTSKQIRNALESEIDMDLREYKEYIDREMLTVLGQMDCASKILDYLYLGSEWNASNLEELDQLGITHILNVTKEIDNFFPDHFRYKTIRLYDSEESNLLPHWNNTWRFIADAKKSGGKCLVHCKMGISRSAATVCAYLMKERLWTKASAIDYVKSCRSIICPNPAFQKQLDEYEGIIFASAQRHNKLFRSRSESSLSEPSVNEDSSRVPHIHVDDPGYGVTMHDFDLNRRLLDLTSAGAPKISRPKSWSPDESRYLYYANSVHTDPSFHRHFNINEVTNRNYRLLNFSEPVHLLAPTNGDLDRRLKLKEIRRDFARKYAHLRRHTTTATPQGGDLSLDVAMSEDSVFVFDGDAFFRPRHSRKREAKTKKNRSSSPAALRCDSSDRPHSLPVQSTPVTPGASALKSPSYINAKNIDIDRLKLRFAVDASPIVDEVSNDTNDVTRDVTSSSQHLSSSLPVRDIVAVIESPHDDRNTMMKLSSGTNLQDLGSKPGYFIRGHHKTASLPPRSTVQSADCLVKASVDDSASSGVEALQTRSRSLSETQAGSFSVKKIVTAIERGNLVDEIPEIDDSDVFHRAKSSPGESGRKKSASSFLQFGDSSKEKDLGENCVAGRLGFYVGDSEKPPPLKIMTWCGTANSNNNNASSPASSPHFKDPYSPESLAPIKETPSSKRPPPYPTDFLHVIEKVGLQLLSSMDSGNKSSKSNEDRPCLSDGGSGKKRGVRQMVREIEKSVRRLRGKVPKVAKTSKLIEPIVSPNQNAYKYITLSPTVSPGLDEDFLEEDETTTDVHVRDLVNRFDTPVCQSPSPVKKSSFYCTSPTLFSTSSVPPKHITDLVSPQPYRSPEKHKAGGATRTKLSSKANIRRSHSERFGLRPSTSKRPGYFRSFRMTYSNFTPVTKTHSSRPELNNNDTPYFSVPKSLLILEKDTPPSNSLDKGANIENLPTPHVHDIVTKIERKCVKRALSSSSVQRSSSMPLSANSTPRPASTTRRTLRKTKSTPFLDCPVSPLNNEHLT